MFRSPQVLKAQAHSHLTLTPSKNYRFASRELFVPIVYSEMAGVAREYLLVFLNDRSLPVTLTGIEQGVNAYVAEDGKWLANYVPGRIRAYPFALTEVPEKKGEFVIAGKYPQMAQPQAKAIQAPVNLDDVFGDDDLLFDFDT